MTCICTSFLILAILSTFCPPGASARWTGFAHMCSSHTNTRACVSVKYLAHSYDFTITTRVCFHFFLCTRCDLDLARMPAASSRCYSSLAIVVLRTTYRDDDDDTIDLSISIYIGIHYTQYTSYFTLLFLFLVFLFICVFYFYVYAAPAVQVTVH